MDELLSTALGRGHGRSWSHSPFVCCYARLCIDRIRAGAREVLDPEVAERELDETLERLDEALAVREALEAMPDACREILDRFFCRDESYAVIGRSLGLPAGTIASRISRCLAKLRQQLEGREQPSAPS